jgi:hypothetical protein
VKPEAVEDAAVETEAVEDAAVETEAVEDAAVEPAAVGANLVTTNRCRHSPPEEAVVVVVGEEDLRSRQARHYRL